MPRSCSTRVFKVLTCLLVAVSALHLTGCGFGTGVSVNSNHARKDGVRLEHKRTVTLDEPVAWQNIELHASAGPVDISAVADDRARLTVTFFEYEPGDAEVYLTETGIAARSATDKPVVIASINGTVPNRPIKLDTGSGNIKARGFQDVDHVILRTGSGNAELLSVSGVATLKVDTGSGGLYIEGVSDIGSLKAGTGSGGIKVQNAASIGSMKLWTGSGGIRVHAADVVETASFGTGSGGIMLKACSAGTIHASTGSGDIRLNEIRYDNLHTSTGSGRVVQMNTPS